MVVGHQKARDTKQKVYRNFGMPNPEGYRKALRAMQFAEKFGRPIFTFVDTDGAYPGLGAEERGQAEAIAQKLARDGAAESSHHRDHHRRRRQRRRAGDCGRRSRADDGELRLLGDFAGGLRVHHVARCQQERSGRSSRMKITADGSDGR